MFLIWFFIKYMKLNSYVSFHQLNKATIIESIKFVRQSFYINLGAFTSIEDDAFVHLKNLRELSIDSDEAKQILLEGKCLNWFSNLEKLMLRGITIQIDSVLSLKNLKILQFDRCNVSIHSYGFKQFNKLIELSFIRFNKIILSSNDSFAGLKSLNKMEFGLNNQFLFNGTFNSFISLSSLNVHIQQLEVMSKSIPILTKSLNKIKFAFVRESDVDFLLNFSSILKELKSISFTNIKFSEKFVGLINDLLVVKKIKISQCDIATLKFLNKITETNRLQIKFYFDVEDNISEFEFKNKIETPFNTISSQIFYLTIDKLKQNIDYKKAFSSLKNLKSLTLANCIDQANLDMKTKALAINKMDFLRDLVVNGDLINKIDHAFLKLNNQITSVDFSLSFISQFDLSSLVDSLSYLNHIEKLSFMICELNNQHFAKNFRFPVTLIHLNLCENQLTSLNSSLFIGLIKLKTLDLSFNKIREVEQGTFYNIPSIEELNLASNLIECLERTHFSMCTKLKHLYLSKNPIFKDLDKLNLF